MSLTPPSRPRIFGTGLVALDLVLSADPEAPVRAWAGGTCGNVLAILAALGWDSYPIARLNGDAASQRVRADLRRWGVQLEYLGCSPTANAPIVIQQILRARDGSPRHRFSWACPHCGSWLPGFKPVTAKAIEPITTHAQRVDAFFMDRLSRSALLLAEHAAKSGAVVIFEPSAKADAKLFSEALSVAHVVKYSDDRFSEIPGAMHGSSTTLVEIQTLGASGLRYRHKLNRTLSPWMHLDAAATHNLVDTCGSGDWCTAGLIATVARHGLGGLIKLGAEGLVEGLQFGQKLAAWNLGFEGARGGMYTVEPEKLGPYLHAMASGQHSVANPLKSRRARAHARIACPACPQPPRKARGRLSQDKSNTA